MTIQVDMSIRYREVLRQHNHPGFDPGEGSWQDLFAHPRFAEERIIVVEIAGLKPGAEAKTGYDSFIRQVTPVIRRCGGSVIKVADVLMPGVGDVEDSPYSGGTALVTSYPSRAHFVDALLTPQWRTANEDRVAGLRKATLLIGRDTMPSLARLLFHRKNANEIRTPRVDGKAPAELVDELLQVYPSGGADPTRRQLEELVSLPGFRTQPLHFINLYGFGDEAAAWGLGGSRGHEAYNREAMKAAVARGAYPYFRCQVEHGMLGDVPWDLCLLVRWPSAAVFIDLRLDPEYVKAQRHRVTAAQAYGNYVTIARED